MGRGFWERGNRKARLASAVRSYNAAITRRERELDEAGEGDQKRYLPKRVTVEEIRERVGEDKNAFRRIVGLKSDAKRGRTSELTRVLKSVRPNALEIVDGMTRYAREQARYDKRANKRLQSELANAGRIDGLDGKPLFDFTPEDLSDPEYAARVDGTILPNDGGEPDPSATDVDDETLNRWMAEDARAYRDSTGAWNYANRYREIWADERSGNSIRPYYEEVLDMLDYLLEEKPRYIQLMFNSGTPELDIHYIIESDILYSHIDFDTRHSRARREVKRWYDKAVSEVERARALKDIVMESRRRHAEKRA